MAFFDFDFAQLTAVGHAAVAMVLGGLVGWERDISGKPAGMRTHMLVAGGSSLLVSLACVAIRVFEVRIGREIVGDPIRVIQTIVVGISFIGGGTIIAGGRHRVHGLTSAASVYFVAALGICVALSQIIAAVGATVLALVVLHVLRPLEQRLEKQHPPAQHRP